MDMRNQSGFSLIEVSIVTAIVLLIAVIGIPAINSYVMENKVPKVGEELARFVVQMRVNAGTSGEAPYTDIGIDNLANMAADSTVLGKSSDGDILHGLGDGGTVEVASNPDGSGFDLTLNNVNHIACPSIASVLQRVATSINVQGAGASVIIKDAEKQYSALEAESACSKGSVNKFVFTIS